MSGPFVLPREFAIPKVSDQILSLAAILARHGFRLEVTGPASKTIRVKHGNDNFGYINSTVIQRKGVLGYHFARHGHASDSCPEMLEPNLTEFFCDRYGCEATDIDVYVGATKKDRTFLIIENAQLALSVLLADAGLKQDPDDVIIDKHGRFLEGRIKDVVMQGKERNASARTACLKHYGYDCFVCGTNLKAKYKGVLVELIHVHHEDPLSNADGERVAEPIEKMKPVCPNCHAVIHSADPLYSIEAVKAMLETLNSS